MNVLTAPKFLRREPQPPALPETQPTVSPEVQAFIDSSARQREELAYLRSENDALNLEVRVSHERIRMLESELTEVRAARDFFQRHDGDMMKALGIIKGVIVAEEANARANAYAPPGTGQLDRSRQGDDLAAGVAALAQKLAPEQPHE